MSVEFATRPPDGRRHDLDALRAFAMVLGIALHSALSFIPAPWPVQDSRQSELFGLFTAVIHGFRMPMFFLISGFFTMMLYRRRGLRPLLRQRASRILLPCLLGLVTVVPLMKLASGWAMSTAGTPATPAEESLADAIRRRDRPAIKAMLERHEELDLPDRRLGITPLAWAAMKGDVESLTLLIDRGADVNKGNRDGSTPLHGAAFLGREDVAEILIERGADVNRRNLGGDRAVRATYADWGITSAILDAIGLPKPEKSRLEEGRERVRRRLEALSPGEPEPAPPSGMAGVVKGYRDFLNSDRFLVTAFGTKFHLVNTGVFDHLWFLWFLCWLVGLFALGVAITRRPGHAASDAKPRRPLAFMLALIPLTLIPQWFMGFPYPGLGPDTSTGLLPPPHILAYYLVFFAYGALSFDAGPSRLDSGRTWRLLLPLGLFVMFPLGLATMGSRPLATIVQVLYAWTMTFGMMGLFRSLLASENRTVRYLSDASYWLYVAHLPLIIVEQAVVRDWPVPAGLKFLMVCVVACGLLLISYQLLVRNTILGVLLNGRRAGTRRGQGDAPAA